MTEVWYCIQTVSNLEGWKKLELPANCASVTIEDIDGRVRRLESVYDVASPPPMLGMTWESLAYRLRRMSMMSHPFRTIAIPPQGTAGCPGRVTTAEVDEKEDAIKAGSKNFDMATLKAIMARVCQRHIDGKEPPTSWLGSTPDGQGLPLVVIAQRLYHAAALHNVAVPASAIDPDQLDQLYAFAVELCLLVESAPHPRMRPPGPPSPPGGFAVPAFTGGPKKACCTCCGCHCHSVPRIVRAPPIRRRGWRRDRKTGWRRFFVMPNWIKRMGCSRSRDYSDSESDSSSVSSGTVVD